MNVIFYIFFSRSHSHASLYCCYDGLVIHTYIQYILNKLSNSIVHSSITWSIDLCNHQYLDELLFSFYQLYSITKELFNRRLLLL